MKFYVFFVFAGLLMFGNSWANHEVGHIKNDQLFQIPSWAYIIAAIIGTFIAAIFLEKRRKKKIRLAKYGIPKSSSHSGGKTRKTRHR
jgi:predicted membrane channel-forming protein YqfA (hemolysin III family)